MVVKSTKEIEKVAEGLIEKFSYDPANIPVMIKSESPVQPCPTSAMICDFKDHYADASLVDAYMYSICHTLYLC